MIFRVEKTESIYLIVEAEDPPSAIQKARSNDILKSESGTIVYGIPAKSNPRPPVPPPPQSWPAALLPLKLLAKPGDHGAGDIIARVIGPIGGDAFKLWYKATFGRDCGCGNRQDALNRRWPL